MDYETLLNAIGEEPEHLYRTERGSTYAHYSDNSTVRNRSGKDHKDSSTGLQPRSGKTVYMDPKDVSHIGGLFQNPEIATKFTPLEYDKDSRIGKAGLVLTEDYGPKKAGTVLHTAPFKTVPSVGASPVEVFRAESPKGDSGKGIHWGNKIIEMGGGRASSMGGSGSLLHEMNPQKLYKKGGTVEMPSTYTKGSWKLI